MRSLILLVLLLCAPARAANDPTFDGTWWGLLDIGPLQLHVVFNLHHEKNAWSGTLQSPDQGPGTLPIETVTVAGDAVTLDMPKLHARFEGKRSDADHIEGTFSQGMAFPLVLQRG